MTASPRKIDLPDALFEDEEDGGGGGGPTPEFLKLVGGMREKLDRRSKRPKTIAAAAFGRALAEVDAMLVTGDWEGATPRHLVALYERMHERCYGVAPEELGPSERYNATLLAGNMVKNKFEGDLSACVEFMLWAWAREIEAEKWRRENDRSGRRIGVRLMFSGSLLTDYRYHLSRTSRR